MSAPSPAERRAGYLAASERVETPLTRPKRVPVRALVRRMLDDFAKERDTPEPHGVINDGARAKILRDYRAGEVTQRMLARRHRLSVTQVRKVLKQGGRL
jgi:hypothetical protein